MRKIVDLLLGVALAVLVFHPARAADIPVKAPMASPYLTYPTGAGFFWGVSASGFGGQTGSTGGLATGNIVGAKAGVDLGYTGNIGGSGFWFVEQNFNWQAIQGPNAGGLLISAAFSMEQRYAVGAPSNVVSKLASLLPGVSSVAFPSVPSISGVSWGPANLYVFGSTWEDDVSVTIGTAVGKSWLLSYGAGVGSLWRGSNGWLFDASVEWKHGAAGAFVGVAPVGGSVQPFNDTVLATGRLKF